MKKGTEGLRDQGNGGNRQPGFACGYAVASRGAMAAAVCRHAPLLSADCFFYSSIANRQSSMIDGLAEHSFEHVELFVHHLVVLGFEAEAEQGLGV